MPGGAYNNATVTLCSSGCHTLLLFTVVDVTLLLYTALDVTLLLYTALDVTLLLFTAVDVILCYSLQHWMSYYVTLYSTG